MRKILSLCIGMFLCLILFASCSKTNSPVLLENAAQNMPSFDTLPIWVTDTLPDGTPSAGMGALGLFNLHINPSPLSAELTSLRQNSSTDTLEVVDITNFLRMAPCSNCVKIKNVALDLNGNIVVNIGVKHPFPAGDPYKPITGRNRADLHVFNIEGIVISNAPGTTFPGIGQTVAGFQLLSADGYTSYLDSPIDEIYPTDATVHPYVLHFDDYSSGNYDPSTPMGFASVTDPPPTGNLVMAMGCDYNFQDYVFKLDPATPIDFIYAVGCTYAISAATKSQRFTPEYRIPQHNKKAASEVHVEIISNHLTAAETSSSAQLEVHVVDVNHNVAVGTSLDQMLADSSVGSINMEIRGILTAPLTIGISSPTGSGHNSTDPRVYSVSITNQAGADLGIYSGLVKVTDTYTTGLNGSPLLNGMDAIKRVDPLLNPLTGLFPLDEFATYAAFTIPIEMHNEPPVADLLPTVIQIAKNGTINWDATASSDPDGSIVQYEWDFILNAGDPANFSADKTTATGTQLSDPYGTTGNYTAAVRVTDNLGATDIATATFEVMNFIPHYWNQWMSNPRHDGRTNMTGPQTNHLEWSFDGLGSNPLTVIEGFDGTIYYGSVSYGGIYAINPNGSQKWIYTPTLSATWSKPLGVTPDNTVLYVGINTGSFAGNITGVDTSTGTELWIYDTWVSANSFGLVLDNGDLVVSGERGGYNSARITKTGAEVWYKSINWNWCTAPAQGPDGTIYVKSQGVILALNADTGATIGQYTYPWDNMQTSFAVRSDGSVVFGTNAVVYCLNPNMTLRWSCPVTSLIIEGFGIGPNDEVYITRSGAMYGISPTGTLQWTWNGASGWASLAVGADGTIYIGTSNGVAAVNPDGSTKWSFATSGFGSGPIIAHDGSLYINISSILCKIKDM